MKKNVFVNAVTNNSPYLEAQLRLEYSLKCQHQPEIFQGYDLRMYDYGLNKSWPSHAENPYAFKIYAIKEALQEGFTHIMWLDASIIAVKNLDPLWDWIDQKGFFMEEAGHYVGSWSNDRTLAYFQITREEAMTMPMFSAGMTGLNFTNPTAREFFARWEKSMLDGQFVGSWSDHRHDMTCASIIANQMGLVPEFSKGGQFFAYVGPGYAPPSESALFHLIGL